MAVVLVNSIQTKKPYIGQHSPNCLQNKLERLVAGDLGVVVNIKNVKKIYRKKLEKTPTDLFARTKIKVKQVNCYFYLFLLTAYHIRSIYQVKDPF